MAEKIRLITKEEWTPRTKLGMMVKNGEVTSLEQIAEMGKPVLEPEIADILMPNLEADTLLIQTTQRTTDSGRKMQFRVLAVVGDHSGHVGIGVGKSVEIRPALDYAIRDAKKRMIAIKFGCGSWECKCGRPHSISRQVVGKQGSTIITLKPAPRGLGLAANKVVKKVTGMAGLKDVWSSATGSTGNVYNAAMATINALDSLNRMRPAPGTKE
ncbi:MAG: 30S ribosomal protein S5 [Candidatus Bilamarchaeaceae archaeon]